MEVVRGENSAQNIATTGPHKYLHIIYHCVNQVMQLNIDGNIAICTQINGNLHEKVYVIASQMRA